MIYMGFFYVLVGLLALIVLWVISVYNFFVSSKARIKASIQEIGNQLKRQADLIPNLESSVKGYLKHEKDIFDKLTDARRAVSAASKSGDLQKMANASSKVSALLPALSIAVEDNPELKGSDVVVRLMDELKETADKVMYARRLVIDLTADYNIRRVTFPSSLVAGIFNFGELAGLVTPESGEHLEVSTEETKSPKVSI